MIFQAVFAKMTKDNRPIPIWGNENGNHNWEGILLIIFSCKCSKSYFAKQYTFHTDNSLVCMGTVVGWMLVEKYSKSHSNIKSTIPPTEHAAFQTGKQGYDLKSHIEKVCRLFTFSSVSYLRIAFRTACITLSPMRVLYGPAWNFYREICAND